jgi:hypothetical protein
MEGVMIFLRQEAELPMLTTLQEFQLIGATLTGTTIRPVDQLIQTSVLVALPGFLTGEHMLMTIMWRRSTDLYQHIGRGVAVIMIQYLVQSAHMLRW